MAVYEAASALQYMHDAAKITFYVDSQAAMNALAAATVSSKLVLQTIQQLNQLTHAVNFVWVEAHRGTEGNEHADELAKEGGKKVQMQRLGLPRGELKAAIQQGIRDKWDMWLSLIHI